MVGFQRVDPRRLRQAQRVQRLGRGQRARPGVLLFADQVLEQAPEAIELLLEGEDQASSKRSPIGPVRATTRP